MAKYVIVAGLLLAVTPFTVLRAGKESPGWGEPLAGVIDTMKAGDWAFINRGGQNVKVLGAEQGAEARDLVIRYRNANFASQAMCQGCPSAWLTEGPPDFVSYEEAIAIVSRYREAQAEVWQQTMNAVALCAMSLVSVLLALFKMPRPANTTADASLAGRVREARIGGTAAATVLLAVFGWLAYWVMKRPTAFRDELSLSWLAVLAALLVTAVVGLVSASRLARLGQGRSA